MARENDTVDIRAELVELLLQKIASERYPSNTMMELVEELITPEEAQAYARVLMDKVGTDAFPSLPMMRRVVSLT